MAKITGIPPFTGTVGNTTIYKLGDQYVVRQKADYGKKEIMRNPKCQRQRENMHGFGFSSSVSRQLRRAWGAMGKIALDATTGPRLTPILYDMQMKGKGLRGNQSIEISKFGQKLEGFTLAKGRSPQSHFTHFPAWQMVTSPAHMHAADETSYTVSILTGKIVTGVPAETTTILQLKFPEGTRHTPQKAPATAKYYAIRLQVTAISDQHWSEKQGAFLPEHGRESTLSTHVMSPYYPVGQKTGAIGTLELALSEAIQPGQNLMITWGIEYFTEENGKPEAIVISKPRSKCRQTACYFEVLAVTQHKESILPEIQPQKETTQPRQNKNTARALRPNITPKRTVASRTKSKPKTREKHPVYAEAQHSIPTITGEEAVRPAARKCESNTAQSAPILRLKPTNITQDNHELPSQNLHNTTQLNNQQSIPPCQIIHSPFLIHNAPSITSLPRSQESCSTSVLLSPPEYHPDRPEI